MKEGLEEIFDKELLKESEDDFDILDEEELDELIINKTFRRLYIAS